MRSAGDRFQCALPVLSRPKLIAPAALALAAVLTALPVVDAAAMNLGMQGSRNGGARQASMTKSSLAAATFGKVLDRTKTTGASRKNAEAGQTERPHHRQHPRTVIIPITAPAIGVRVPGASSAGAGTPPNVGGSGQPPSGSNSEPARRAGSGVPPANETRFAPDQVVVELAGHATDRVLDAMARRHRLTRLQSLNFRLGGTTLARLRINDRRSVAAVVRALEADRTIISAQPNYYSDLVGETGQSAAPALEQYALAKLQLPQAHELARGDKVLVAVIDSGVDTEHPELAGVIAESFDAVGFGDKVHSHGTAVAGAIAAHARLQGAAPAAQILAVRAFGALRGDRRGTTFDIAGAIDWTVAKNPRIINMSFAGPRDPKIELSVKAAYAKGIVLIAAAGNGGPQQGTQYPAGYAGVIAVTATDEDDNLFHAANRGDHVAVAAPGVDVVLPAPNGTYQVTSGTSFSAAEISGTAALLLERQPSLGPAGVRHTLMSTARDLGPQGIDPLFGAGLVDAYRALLSLAPATVGQAGVTSAAN
ncbi:MAG: hypothetical protein QOI12_4539 [Alphaproteobacteria bacterium]|jgi:subtilisin family serine protease|nr:hypothetical protein [Alphaproteobacteria bacterium]